ncbi:tripartite tricarboxylate transporter substrate binding protein [Ramlibacter sp. G-1-2-2]|uniref:Tripartite tricarboxylate transporter substrate binding protein n=1 Tax=Ramlibacter agri TaxID=2728837 RepID=A0A848H9B9_9BURK|nr:tripartite tricarboxylate transporter substrate binding protein [Ramlibacter agri]NML47586.1 tripartite tricarboxylate transporter substrate binding protein [Ramlibacter agri]
MPRRALRRLILGAALFASLSAFAQGWPTKPIHFIVGYPAGSSPDMQARLLAEPLSKALGQTVVVENRPGASGNLGAEALARATDGHTIAIIGNGPLTSSAYLYSRLGYDPAKDFAPIAMVASGPLVMVAPKSLGLSTPQKLIDFARAQGDKINFGSSGAGSGTHLGMELLKRPLGINPVHVPYAGAPQIITNLLGGQLQMALLPPSTVQPLVDSGKLDALFVSSEKRSPMAPTLPSLGEIGVKGINIEVWNAIMAPASMPAANQARLSAELDKILNNRDIRQKLLLQGWKVDDTSAKGLAARIKSDSALYRDIITRNNIRLD